MNLTKDQCKEMKGLAILSIALHNYLHQPRFRFAEENEFSFDKTRILDFFDGIQAGFPSFLCETISFLGWMGVPVFVFLSGYGLVRKYESGPQFLPVKDHLFHSWKKLFWLLLPAILLLFLMHWGDWTYWGRNFLCLSMLTNLFAWYPSVHVYWYFGLTFELYCLYILFNKYRNNGLLLSASILVIILQFLLTFVTFADAIDWNMHNFIGWIPVFSLGIYAARRNSPSLPRNPILWLVLAVMSAGGIILCNLNGYLWVFSQLLALILFLSVMNIIDLLPKTRKVFLYIGDLSAFLFVGHPLARTLTNILQSHLPDNLLLLVIVYLILAFAFAYLFRTFNRFVNSGFKLRRVNH